METLRDYVNWGLTHCDKTASAEGVPLILEKCVKNKKMKQLEVYGQCVQNGTPSPEAPVEVESVGEKTDNLFDPNVPNQHGFIHSDGTIHASSSFPHIMVYTFEVKPNTDYVYLCGLTKNPTYALYDEEMTFIKSGGLVSTSGGPIKFSTTADSAYVKLCVNQNRVDRGEQYFNEGTVPTQEPYGKYKIPVTVRGKNLFKPTVASATAQVNNPPTQNGYGTTIDSVDLTDNSVTVTQVARTDHTVEYYTNGYFTIKTDGLEIGKSYKFSFDIDIKENPLNASRIMVMPSGQYPVGWCGFTETTQRVSCTFTHNTHPDGRLPYLEIRCMGMSFTASNFMITEEGQDDTYEPYIEPQTTNIYLNEPLRRIGNYADYIDFKGKKVVRKTKEKVFDGSESWAHELVGGSDRRNNFFTYLADSYGNNALEVLCNVGKHNGTSLTDDFTCRVSSLHNFNFRYQAYDNVTDFKAKLTEMYNDNNPMILNYVLAIATEESIDCALPILPAKTSVVEVDTSLLPSNIKGKYIKR